MKLTVNGEARTVADGTTLLAFLKGEGIAPDTVVAEWNGGIVPADALGTTALADGGALELLRFVGGG